MEGFSTPILFIIFNRLDTSLRVFEEIRKQKPKKLYIAADGPRKNNSNDIENCKKTREIINKIDWSCDLKTLFRDDNLGCGRAVSGAINWFFENEEMGIILEDDCLPHKDFFGYCEQLLVKYKDKDSIKLITGDNFQKGNTRGDASYYFSAYSHIWGWASWSRVWRDYDFSMSNINKNDFVIAMKSYGFSAKEREIWLDKYELLKKNRIDTWDYQFSFSIWKNRGLNIIPNSNLISNIGFGESSTHTKDKKNPLSNLPTQPILPLTHPEKIEINRLADDFFYDYFWHKKIVNLVYRRLRRMLLSKKV